MVKITVIDIVDIGTQLEGMNHDQLVEFYTNVYNNENRTLDDFVSTIKSNKELKDEKIPELQAIILSTIPGVYFILAKDKSSGVNVFIEAGKTLDGKRIYKQNIRFTELQFLDPQTSRRRSFLTPPTGFTGLRPGRAAPPIQNVADSVADNVGVKNVVENVGEKNAADNVEVKSESAADNVDVKNATDKVATDSSITAAAEDTDVSLNPFKDDVNIPANKQSSHSAVILPDINYINFVIFYNKNYLAIERSLMERQLIISDFISADNPVKIKENIFMKASLKLKINYVNYLTFIETIYKITNNFLIFKLNEKNFNEVIDEIKEIYDNKIDYSEIIAAQNKEKYKRIYFNSIAVKKYGNKILTDKEKNVVQNYINLKEDYNKSLLNNKCKHIHLYNKFRGSDVISEKKYFLKKIKEYISNSRDQHGLLKCRECNFTILCSHLVDEFDLIQSTTSEFKINKILSQYVDENIPGHFCKICGEKLYDNFTLNINKTISESSNDELSAIIWREVRTAVNNIRFNVKNATSIDPNNFINVCIDTLAPWLKIVYKKEQKNLTNSPDDITAMLNIHATIYAYTLIGIISLNNNLIEILNLKITKSNKDNIENILNLIIRIRAVDIRLLGLKINTDYLRGKISAAYNIMYKIYNDTSGLSENIIDVYYDSLDLGVILNRLSIDKLESRIIKDEKILPHIIIPNLPNTSLIKLYAESLKKGVWPCADKDLSAYFDNISKLPAHYKKLPIMINEQFEIAKRNSEIQLKLFVDANGEKYNWDIFIFKNGEFAAKDCLKSEGDILDMKSSTGVLLSAVKKSNVSNQDLIKILNKNTELSVFLDKVRIICPETKGEHIYKGEECEKCGFDLNFKIRDIKFEEYYNKYYKRPNYKYEEKTLAPVELITPTFITNELNIKEFCDMQKIATNDLLALREPVPLDRDDIRITDFIYLLQGLSSKFSLNLYDLIIAGKMTLPLDEIIPFLIQTLTDNFKKLNAQDEMKSFFDYIRNIKRPERFARWDLISKTMITAIQKSEEKFSDVNQDEVGKEVIDEMEIETPFGNNFDTDADFDNDDNTL
jgi:hypothetical protein